MEALFAPGMSWTNYGAWHIDHVYPLSRVDLSDPKKQRQACNFLNLQPLWAVDNIRKGDRLPGE